MPEFHEVTRPYPGLRPFESWEGEIFFGREEHTNRLLDILQQQRFLAVIGPSGSGKSSLVRAGLLPALPLGSLGTGSDWRIALLRPGNRPMQRLAHALLGRSALGIELVGEERIPQDERHLTPDVALIEAELRRGPLGLIEVVKDARNRHLDADGFGNPLPPGEGEAEPFNLLVLVDQFEEIFTYADAGGRQADESEAFVNLLLASRTASDVRIYIVLTMRTDFLGNCVRFLELPDAINRAQYLTPRLTREQIERAITGPARLFDGDVEPTLVAELINAVGNDPDQLPILQHALARMWESAHRRDVDTVHIGWDDFEAVGGITGALSRHADEILASLSPENKIEEPLSPEQRTAEVLFRAITGQRSAEAGGQAVRRPQSLDQLAKWSGRDWQDFLPVVRAFAQEHVNFLNYVGELTPETVIDISHEALIRQWNRLQGWVTEEARLAGEYRRWRERAEAKASGTGALLTGADLARAVEWRFGNLGASWKPTPAWASRYSRTWDEHSDGEFNNVLKFIDESQQVVLRAEKRERRIKWFMAGLTVVSLTAMTVAIGFWNEAHNRLIASEAAALWHPLDFSGSSMTEKQAAGLLRLARSDESHKREFLEQLLKGEALAGWFNHQPQAIISAAVGLNLERRSWFLGRLSEIAPENEAKDVLRVARALALLELDGKLTPEGLIAAIRATQDHDQLAALGRGVAAVAGKVPEAQAGAVAEKFLTAILTTDNSYQLGAFAQGLAALPVKLTEAQAGALAEKFLAAIQATKDIYRLEALGQGVAAVAGKVPEAQAGALAEKFVAAIRAAKDYDQLLVFGQGVAALPVKLTEAQAEPLVEKFLAAIQATRDYSQLKVLGEGVAAVAGKVPDAQAGALAEKFVAAIQAARDLWQLWALGQGVAALPVQLTEAQAGAVVEKLLAAIQATKAYYQLGALDQGVAAVARKVPEAQAGTVVEKFVAAIQATQVYSQLQALGEGVAALAGKVPEAQAGAVAEKFVAAIQAAQDDQLVALGQGVAALPVQLMEAQAGAVAEKFVAAIQAAQQDDQLVALGQGVAALPVKLTEAQAEPLVEKFLAAIQATQDYSQLQVLGQGVAAVVGKVPEAQAGAVAEKLLAAIQITKAPDQVEALGQGLAAVADRISDDDQAASLFFEVLKNPVIPRDTIPDAVRKRFPDAPPKEQGFWALIEWADKRFPDLDLEAPLKEPSETAATLHDPSP